MIAAAARINVSAPTKQLDKISSKADGHAGAGAKENDAGARMCATIGMGPNLSQTDSGSAHHYAQASSFPRILMARPYLVRRLRP